ncbi:hypothetical protein GLOIN_2v1801166 [Rhizophagus irregularis DAOM 181602=DAOM 197198]|nr:hypothetical protein GLOIN_2v1801166 [Rhizophagus irregularis DAOM 181602=DAOM 197198]
MLMTDGDRYRGFPTPRRGDVGTARPRGRGGLSASETHYQPDDDKGIGYQCVIQLRKTTEIDPLNKDIYYGHNLSLLFMEVIY